VAKARQAARELIVDVRRGQDPIAQKRSARAARIAELSARSVEQAIAEWKHERSCAPIKQWSESYLRNITSAFRVHLPPRLAKSALRTTSREDWTTMLSAASSNGGPGAAAFLYTVTSSFLSFAEAKGWIAHHLLPRNGRTLIAPHLPARQRVLSDEEWLSIWRASDAEPPKLRAFVRLSILAATRAGETAGIAANEISLDYKYWHIPGSRTKNGLDHTIPISGLALAELIAASPPGGIRLADTTPILGRIEGRKFTGQGKLLARLQARSEVRDWSWHDLRRTVRTRMTELGVSADDAEAALNHVSGKSRLIGIYDHASTAPAAVRALRVWQEYVTDIVSGKLEPGDAERRYCAGLPDEVRGRNRATVSRSKKGKPGKKHPPAHGASLPHQAESST
jgi:integrase